jgi:hypothetical protein
VPIVAKKFDKKIQVTRSRIEGIRGRRPEKFQPFDIVLAAKLGNLRAVLFDDTEHG